MQGITDLAMTAFSPLLLLLVTILDLDHASAHPELSRRNCRSKRGAAYNNSSAVPVLASGGKISWAYNWDASSNGEPGVEFVPMMWGSRYDEETLDRIDSAVRDGSTHILGFNEPDHSEQANMSPSDAASVYKQYITPFVDRAQLVSPATTNGADGLDWMGNFLKLCSDCEISVMAVHWYGATADDFKEHITKSQTLAAQHGLDELWVTEFALAEDMTGTVHDPTSSVEFLRQVLPWLDQQCNIGRYAYFMTADNYLLDGTSLSQTGEAYVN